MGGCALVECERGVTQVASFNGNLTQEGGRTLRASEGTG